MKKIFSLGICLVLCLLLVGCGNSKTDKENDKQNEAKKIGNYDYKKTIKCDVLDKVQNLITFNEDTYVILTNDNQAYLTSINQLYSNDMNCKKIADVEVSVVSHYSFIDKQGYEYHYNYQEKDLQKSDNAFHNFKLLVNNNITLIDNSSFEYYLLKNDGTIYESSRNGNGIEKIGNLVKQIDNEIIKDFYIKQKNMEEKAYFTYLITDKSFMAYKETITNKEECNKYADVKCESTYEWVKDEEVSNQMNNFVIVKPWLLIKDSGEVYINEQVRGEYFGG